MDYLVLKTLHILSSVVLVGTGFGTAFYLYAANRSGSVEAIAVVSRLVVRADWMFTTPAVIAQPTTGLLLIHKSGFSLGSRWIVASLVLYAVAGACWLPVVVYQIRMRKMAGAAHAAGESLPEGYWRLSRKWELLGYPAFAAMIAIYFLMVIKPS
jgi:uncharacterized membrane protein